MTDNRMAEENPGPDGADSGGQPPTAAGGAPWAEDDSQSDTARRGADSPARGDAEPPARGGTAPSEGTAGSETTDGETRRQLLKAGIGLGAVGVIGYGYLRTQEEVVAVTDGSTVDDVPERS